MAERRAGEFLREMPKAKPGPKKIDTNLGPNYSTLNDLGISKNESSRWQRIAQIPEERFEEYLVTAKKG